MLLTTNELAQKLRISRSTLYSIRYEKGFPPAIKIGRQYRWNESDIDFWLTKKSPKQ